MTGLEVIRQRDVKLLLMRLHTNVWTEEEAEGKQTFRTSLCIALHHICEETNGLKPALAAASVAKSAANPFSTSATSSSTKSPMKVEEV